MDLGPGPYMSLLRLPGVELLKLLNGGLGALLVPAGRGPVLYETLLCVRWWPLGSESRGRVAELARSRLRDALDEATLRLSYTRPVPGAAVYGCRSRSIGTELEDSDVVSLMAVSDVTGVPEYGILSLSMGLELVDCTILIGLGCEAAVEVRRETGGEIVEPLRRLAFGGP